MTSKSDHNHQAKEAAKPLAQREVKTPAVDLCARAEAAFLHDNPYRFATTPHDGKAYVPDPQNYICDDGRSLKEHGRRR